MQIKTLILGLGNTLLGDEGVGVHTIHRLRQASMDLGDVELLDGGTLSFILAGPIEEADELIVIDAAQLDSEPGTVRFFKEADMDDFVLSKKNTSVHEVSLSDLLVITHLSGQLPQRRALIGIQPERIDWSDTLTDSVAQAIPSACDLIHELLCQWRHEARRIEQK